jgi:hypothetical protein
MLLGLGIHLTLLLGPTIPIPAPASLIEALKSIQITNTDSGRDGFQIIFSVGRSGPIGILDYPTVINPLLRPFNRVIIMVTLGAIPKVLIDGIITNHQLAPSNEPGQSTLTITGEDVSVMMNMKEKSTTHPNQPDILIISKIIVSYGQFGLIPMVILPPFPDVPIIVDRIPSQQGTDLQYIMQLAGNRCVFYIEPTDIPGLNIAYWGPKNQVGIPQKALTFNMGSDTNTTSINFQNNALSPVMVTGYVQERNFNLKVPIKTFLSLRPPLSSMPSWLFNMPNVKKKEFRSEGGENVIQALEQAQAETDNSMDVITASGELDTLRYGNILRARKLVGVRGVGYSYDGLYYVKSVTHNLKRGEYKQSFTLTREGLGSLTPVLPP